MERPSIFSRVRRLFASSGFPDENYLTELVASLIERQPVEFVSWLRKLEITEFSCNAALKVTTRYYCAKNPDEQTPEKYPDLMIRLSQNGSEEILFIESKVGSELSGRDQLQQYARILSLLPASRRTLLFITRDYLPQNES